MTGRNRRTERAVAEIKVDYRSSGNFVTDYSANLSQTGVFIRTSSPLQIGEQIRIRFQLPGDGMPFGLDGRVKWISTGREQHGHPSGMGVEFVDVPIDTQARIDALLGVVEP